MKLAVYSANFGNYRGELREKTLNSLNLSKEIDYYFFTEKDIKLIDKWNVQKIDLEKELDFMNSCRNTSKVVKLCLPKVLNSYDYAIWCDTKSLLNINNLNLNKIEELISKKNKKIYLINHPRRKTTMEELKATVRLEKQSSLSNFTKIVKDIDFNSNLPNSTTFIRKVDQETNDCFEKVYQLLLDYKLCRDQNVIEYAFHVMNFESKLYYFEGEGQASPQLFRKLTQQISQ